MNLKLSSTEKMLFISVGFTIMLLVVRSILTKEFTYRFYVWNTFLAIMPFLFSKKLVSQNKISLKAILLLLVWLLFFPNAPYLITDIIHFKNTNTRLKWIDVIIIISSSWNGLILAVVSLINIETFLNKFLRPAWTTFFIALSIGLCSYGIYLGRILRFNSWDVLIDTDNLFSTSINHFKHPFQNKFIWEFSLVVSLFLSIIYFTIKQIAHDKIK